MKKIFLFLAFFILFSGIILAQGADPVPATPTGVASAPLDAVTWILVVGGAALGFRQWKNKHS